MIRAALVTVMLATTSLALSPPTIARAQSTTTGVLAGTIVSEDGGALSRVQLTLRGVGGGLAREVETGPEGEFLVALLEPGDYELRVERLGYRPLVITPIPVRALRRTDIRGALVPVDGPVQAPDTVAFEGLALAGGSIPGASQHFDWELRSLPQRDGDLDEVVGWSSAAGEPLAVEGLPSSLGAVVVRGTPFRPAAHGAADDAWMSGTMLPTLAAGHADVLPGRPDVEWPGVAGGILQAGPLPPVSGVSGVASGVWSPEGAVVGSDPSAPAGASAMRAGALLRVSMAGDSAQSFLVAEGQQRSSSARYWPEEAAELVPDLALMGLDVSPLAADRLAASQRLSVGGGFDWRFSGGEVVEVVALYGRGEREQTPSPLSGRYLPVELHATDFLAAASASAQVAESVALQLRLGFAQSGRERQDPEGPETGLGDAAVAFAPHAAQLGDPLLRRSTDRSAFSAEGVAHFRSGAHHLKGGLGGQVTQHDRTWADPGLFLFSDAAGYADRTGVYHQLTGSAQTADFSVMEAFVYGQDSWRVAPGLDLVTGVRYELELLPASDIRFNRRWQELTGLDNTAVPEHTGQASVVAGFDWNLQERHRWRVRGALAMNRGDVAPELLAEALTHDGRLTATAAVGDITQVTQLGPRLTLLSPGLRPPSSTRVSLGVSRALGSGAALHLSGALRQTDNLPRRTDLNLATSAPYRDQHGRAVHGELTRVGQLLVAEPGANRRFGEFETVSAITSGASSTYWGLTAALEKRVGSLRAHAAYTYSRTEDDWLGAGSLDPMQALAPFGDSNDQGDWVQGVSDFDVPHRVTLATELQLPFARAVRLGAHWQRSSGRPFTPGYGTGIDINADGVAGNDPAFIDPSVAGMDELQGEWDCLRDDDGRFATRNGCRGEDRSLLDLWLALRLPISPVRPELRIEALGLASDDGGILDAALYQLDPAGEVVADPASGTVTIPLAVNPQFGQPLRPVSELARIRISFSVGF